MKRTITIWYELTDPRYAAVLEEAARLLRSTGYIKLHLNNVTLDDAPTLPPIEIVTQGAPITISMSGHTSYGGGGSLGNSVGPTTGTNGKGGAQ
jgi:hypothetical protein